MWTRIVSLAALAALLLTSHQLGGRAVLAQDAGAARCKAAAANLWGQVDWLRLEISGGRIALGCRRCGQVRLAAEPTEADPTHQSLAVDAQPGSLIATYEAADDRERIALTIDARRQVTVVRQAAAGAAGELRYVQPHVGPVLLTVGGGDARKLAAASLWHLLAVEPAAREQLLPVLAKIRPTWRLSEQLGAAEGVLADAAGNDASAERRKWQAWVDQLADASFARRAQADRALREAGQAVVVHLRQLDPQTLDREQRQRVLGILAAVGDFQSDSPERIAGWLADDQRVWLALLSRPDARTRQAAARHLTLLSGQRIAIDPSASDERQAQQLVELKALLAEH
jgi:hypothetical protein